MPETLSRILVAIELSIALLVSLPFLVMFIGGTLSPMFDEVTRQGKAALDCLPFVPVFIHLALERCLRKKQYPSLSEYGVMLKKGRQR